MKPTYSLKEIENTFGNEISMKQIIWLIDRVRALEAREKKLTEILKNVVDNDPYYQDTARQALEEE